MSRKTKNIDHELCDYDEAYDRESASDIGWCGKCKIPECPYNKDLNEKRRMGWKNTDGMTVDDLLKECKQELN